jgi:hypothetical protein
LKAQGQFAGDVIVGEWRFWDENRRPISEAAATGMTAEDETP